MTDRERRRRRYLDTFRSQTPSRVVQGIRRGEELPTFAVAELSNSEGDVRFRTLLVRAGLVEVLLGFLDGCSSLTFEQARGDGDMPIPFWVDALGHLVFTGCLNAELLDEKRLLVAQRIGPLSDCMADPRREFFLNREYWIWNVWGYVGLLRNLAESRATWPLLFEQQAVVDFLIQSLFWERFRPDIMEDLRRYRRVYDQFEYLVQYPASWMIVQLCDHRVRGSNSTTNPNTGQALEAANRLASTKAVCPSYTGSGSDTDLTLYSATVELLKTRVGPDLECKLLSILQLLSATDYLGKGAVKDFIQIGQNVRTEESALLAVSILHTSLLGATGSATPDDERFAIAILAGLFETCLQFQVDYGTTMRYEAYSILSYVDGIALSAKTARAIRRRESLIRAKIEAVQLLNLPHVSELADFINDITDKSLLLGETTCEEVFCHGCGARVPPVGLRLCGGCELSVYCSKACFKRDWKEGDHKLDCKIHGAESSGGSIREKNRMFRARENVRMAAERYLRNNVDEILMVAPMDVVDCVVVVDFAETPPQFYVDLPDEFLDNLPSWLEIERDVPDETYVELIESALERNQHGGALTVACRSFLTAGPQKGSITFDLISIPADGWNEKQQELTQSSGP